MFAQLTLLLLPIAAGTGWYFARKDQAKHSTRGPIKLRHDYFLGLNYLINEQPDKAVDVFIKLLEVDGDTVETHLALGNLFRRRGEVDRAIRVHQNLIARPQLDRSYRVQALSALGQDYLTAGVLDRAERLFLELVDMNEENQQSLRFLLHIYQQEKDWAKAIDIAQKLQAITSESMYRVIAQYYCELALQMKEKRRSDDAYYYLKKAQSTDRYCVRASLIQAELEREAMRYKEAIRCYKRVKDQDPDFLSEIITPLAECYECIGEETKFVSYLEASLQEHPRISIVLAISEYLRRERDTKAAIEFIAQQIQTEPSLRGVNHLVELYLMNSSGEVKERLSLLHNFIQQLLRDRPIYRCLHCGFSGKTLFWLCPSCHHWMTIKPIQGLE